MRTRPPLQHARGPPRQAPAAAPDLLPLAVGGELLGRDEDAEFEDRLQLGGEPLGLEVLELGLGLPDERHVQAQAEHADREPGARGRGEPGNAARAAHLLQGSRGAAVISDSGPALLLN